jgi:hypothetical protein
MHQFTDSQNDKWDLRITAGTVRRCAELLGVDIGDPMRGDPPMLTRFDTDIVFKVNTLWAVLKLEAEKKGFNEDQFAERLEGDALQAAHDAFYAELLDFFQSLHRADVVEAIRRQMQIVAKGVEIGARAVASERTTEAINQGLTALGDAAADLLASSVASLSPERSAN